MLWAGYLDFYETSLPEAVTAAARRRLLDPASPVFGRVAEGEGGRPIGLGHCIRHALSRADQIRPSATNSRRSVSGI